MRVLLDTSYANRGPSGTAVYLDRLAAALRERGTVELLEARQERRLRPGSGNPLRSGVNAVLDAFWLHVGLPRAARAARADVVHHPLPVSSRRMGAPQVVTVHDLAFKLMPEGYGLAWRLLAGRQQRRAVRRAGAVVCVSETAASQAAELLGAPHERIVVAPHGPGQPLPAPARSESPRHFLYVGDAEPRKNVGALLDAYREYRDGAGHPLELVLAGRAGRLAGAPGVRGEQGPDAERLGQLLAGAAALVHPSRHEGFGLTLLEGMAVGTPVVAVRGSGVEEIVGDAALLVARDDLGGALARIAGDPELRERLARAGRDRAAGFSWERSATLHERAYTLAAQGK